MQNEFEGFQRNPLRTMQGTWEVGTETARLVEIGLANLELSLHINAKLNLVLERLSLMETQDDQLLAIDKTLVADFGTLATTSAAILAKLSSSPAATTDPIVAEVITDFGALDTSVQALNTQLAAALPVPAPVDPNAPAA